VGFVCTKKWFLVLGWVVQPARQHAGKMKLLLAGFAVSFFSRESNNANNARRLSLALLLQEI
jgi:hypothetical protein